MNLLLTHFKGEGKGQGQARFDSQYVKWWQIGIRQTVLLPSNIKLHIGFWLAYFDVTLAHSKVKVMHILTANISKMVTHIEHITTALMLWSPICAFD